MKKSEAYKFDCYSFLKEQEQMKREYPVIEQAEKRESAVDSIIRQIYALDPLTNLPTGDIGYYVSDKANPEIKAFILQNLFMDTSSAATPAIPDGIDADLALDLMRQKDETPEMYKERLNKFAVSNVKMAESLFNSSKPSSDAKVES